jgi:hypothetical protein
MDRRRNQRVATLVPVRVWGLDARSMPFTQLATVTNISSSGAVIEGMHTRIRPGEILDVQFGSERTQFRVVWTGKPGTRRGGEIGLERLAIEPYIWGVDLRQCQLVAEG